MSTDIVQIQFSIAAPSDQTWFSQVCYDFPSIQIKIVSILPFGDSGASILVIFKGPDSLRCASKLQPGSGIVATHILHVEEDRIFVHLKIDRAIILHTIIELGIPIKYPVTVEGGRIFMELITERGHVDDFLTSLTEGGFKVTMQHISPVNMKSLLTETQETILKTAMQRNYFDIPRGIK